jgi:hypothetical protein
MREVKAGDLVKVTNAVHYTLPAGLRDGDVVKLISFDHGYWTAEKHGQEYRVFLCRLDPGWEYEIGERWVPETDGRVPALRKKGAFEMEH